MYVIILKVIRDSILLYFIIFNYIQLVYHLYSQLFKIIVKFFIVKLL